MIAGWVDQPAMLQAIWSEGLDHHSHQLAVFGSTKQTAVNHRSSLKVIRHKKAICDKTINREPLRHFPRSELPGISDHIWISSLQLCTSIIEHSNMSRSEAAINFFNEQIDAIPGSPGDIRTLTFDSLKQELANEIREMLNAAEILGGDFTIHAQNQIDEIFNTIDNAVADPEAKAAVAKLSAQTIGSGGPLNELQHNSETARRAMEAALNEPLQEQNGRFELPAQGGEEQPGAGGELDPGEHEGHELDPGIPVPEPPEPGVPVEPPVEPFDPAAEGHPEGPPGGLPFER
jgi:hypothetical protein